LIRRLALCVLFLAFRTFDASAQTKIVFRDAGPGPGPELLVRALAGPHAVVTPASGEYVLRKDSTYSQTLIILGRNAVIEGTVRGDVIIVDGDLTLHPGARIEGRAVAIGGGVYESALAKTGSVAAFRDFVYDISETGSGFELTYHALGEGGEPGAVQWPGLYGLLLPSYDRTNGLSVPVGVDLTVKAVALEITPRLTYRSQLGRMDPSIAAQLRLTRGSTLLASLGRSTFSNDAWIRSDLVNSLHVIGFGNDTRNYFRATRGEARAVWFADSSVRFLSGYVGVRGEHALSVRPDIGAAGGPWAFRGRRDIDDMIRPNPQIDNGKIGSVIAGAAGDWLIETVSTRAAVDVEVGRATADSVVGIPSSVDRTFGQVTLDGTIEFPTFGTQSLRFDGHAVFTTRGATPRQRFAYLGGSGTLPPLDLLELGGDQLLYLDGRYLIPIDRVRLPVVNAPPIITLREAIGGADIGRAPSLHQAVGLRISISAAYAEFMVDPATRNHHFGFGLALIR
jgi:hypothetical protein